MNLLSEFIRSLVGIKVKLLTDYVAPCSVENKNVELKRGLVGKVVGQAPGAMEMRVTVNFDGRDYPVRVECLERTLI